ncbi:adenosylcobinamide-phosphate synthase CbiB [soil metagenome]
MVGSLWLALAIDQWLGEPPVRWHPVVWMGNYLGWIGGRIPTPPPQAVAAGALAWSVGAGVVCVVAITLQNVLLALPAWATIVSMALLLKPLLAWRMLRREVLAVEAALDVSIDAGRAQLARLVSRDVAALTEDEVRESAIESLAENLNDSVVAPVFWFVLLGLPGAAVYRFANTADAMWGYRGERGGRDWTWAGKWAARADDVLSWLPARITALLLILPGRLSLAAWRALRAEAARTPSPNSGWPMAAMALTLGVRLGKPGVYLLNAKDRSPVAADTARAASLGNRCVLTLAAIASIAMSAWS